MHEFAGKPGARVFVDGVKSISRIHALIASGVGIDRVIHLVRNPGDCMKSAQKTLGGSRRHFLASGLAWRFYHNRARRLRHKVPYLSLSYEALSDHVNQSLQVLHSFLGVAPRALEDLQAAAANRPWHFVGNASLLNFDGTVRRSRHVLSRPERLVARLLAGHYRAHVAPVTEVGR